VIINNIRRALAGGGIGPKGAPQAAQAAASSLATELHLRHCFSMRVLP